MAEAAPLIQTWIPPGWGARCVILVDFGARGGRGAAGSLPEAVGYSRLLHDFVRGMTRQDLAIDREVFA